MTAPVLRCPHCGGLLSGDALGLACPLGHSFDRAREGYVNLLPAGRHRGRAAGDDATMVRARRAVFDAGLYRPLIDAVAAAVADSAPGHVLDVGCGEGSYLAAATSRGDARGWGIDISRPAIRLAARRHREHTYAVASAHLLPFADGAFDTVINVFAPREAAEMRRVLRPGGTMVVARPGPDHLHELRSALYDAPRASDRPSDLGVPARNERIVRFPVALDDPVLRLALLQMTPFWWSSSAPRRARALEAISAVTADVVVSVHDVSAAVPTLHR